MDLLLHVLWGIMILGIDVYVILGSILPDSLYLISVIEVKFKLEKLKNSKLFIWGERIHSFFFIPIILILLYVFIGAYVLIKIVVAYYLHLLFDIFTHRDFGPRFCWPFIDSYFPRGVIQWENTGTIFILYSLSIFALVLRFLII